MSSKYLGEELDLFALAKNWKTYWEQHVLPWLGGKVLEVGAGIGGTTRNLLDRVPVEEWICLEPDRTLAARIPEIVGDCRQSDRVRVKAGYLEEHLPALAGRCDAVLYIDVIEHIEQDRAELGRALRALKPGGRLVVLVPAHGFLFSAFDQALGHPRRYNRKRLLATLPTEFSVEILHYLDSVGIAASAANAFFLKQSLPTRRQIAFWDRYMVPTSRVVDPLLLHRVGKSLFLVARK